jgi:hypothetical protein
LQANIKSWLLDTFKDNFTGVSFHIMLHTMGYMLIEIEECRGIIVQSEVLCCMLILALELSSSLSTSVHYILPVHWTFYFILQIIDGGFVWLVSGTIYVTLLYLDVWSIFISSLCAIKPFGLPVFAFCETPHLATRLLWSYQLAFCDTPFCVHFLHFALCVRHAFGVDLLLPLWATLITVG